MKVIIWGINFAHSQIQELAGSLIQELNDNNKYNVKESYLFYIKDIIILKSLMICPFW